MIDLMSYIGISVCLASLFGFFCFNNIYFILLFGLGFFIISFDIWICIIKDIIKEELHKGDKSK